MKESEAILMENRQYFTVSQIAAMFNLPSSVIRYWNDQGLIHSVRHPDNGYRLFTLEDLLLINDISYYRKLGAPVKKLKELGKKSVDDQLLILEQTELTLAKEIAGLQARQRQLEEKKKQIQLFKRLSNQGIFLSEAPRMTEIIEVALDDSELGKELMASPMNLGIVLHATGELVDYGYASMAAPDEANAVLWRRSDTDVVYYQFLLTIVGEAAQLDTVTAFFAEKQLKAGKIVGQYLLSKMNEDGCYTEYYQAWIEAYSQ